jgi:transcriptional regulator with XRE-family HTH domain
MAEFKVSLYQLLGKKIRTVRTELNLKQEDLAKELGLGRTSISNIETGKHQIPLFTLYQLSRILKTDIHLILPTYNEVIENMDSDNFSDYKTVLEKESLKKQTRTDLENLIKNL